MGLVKYNQYNPQFNLNYVAYESYDGRNGAPDSDRHISPGKPLSDEDLAQSVIDTHQLGLKCIADAQAAWPKIQQKKQRQEERKAAFQNTLNAFQTVGAQLTVAAYKGVQKAAVVVGLFL